LSEKRAKPPTQQPSFAQEFFQLPIAEISPIQETAMRLFMLGFNVFPVPYGRKGGYPWAMMQYTRLNAQDVYPLFRDNCNIAVMTGRTSSNLFVIDCETTVVFEHHKELLKAANIPIWAVRSAGRRGGGHLYLRCLDGEVKNIRAGERKDVEIRGNRCYVLAPPSLHPDTKRTYEWDIRESVDPPAVTASQVHWLGLSITKDSPKHFEPQPFSELSSPTRDFILNGASEGERNDRLFSAACDLSGNGYDEYDAQRLLIPVSRKVGLGEREIRDTITSAFSKPRTPAKPTAKKNHRPASWQLAHQWASHRAWPGRTGQTDRAVFLACCERAKTANEVGVFRAATREIAEMARIRPNTAGDALKRLETAKFLIFCGKDRDSGSHLYRLGSTTTKETMFVENDDNQKLRNRYTTTYTSGDDSVSLTQEIFSSDAAEWGALNKTAYQVYLVLRAQDAPIKPGVIRLLGNLSQFQVSRALKKLSGFHLVKKVKGSYVAVVMSADDLDEMVARPAGTFGRATKRREKHQQERSSRAAERLYKARFGAGRNVVLARSSEDHRQGFVVHHKCGNCGQLWAFSDIEPPLKCDYCGDVTTWQLIVE
jgi:DNA-binding transcriptional ArsR family regulator